MGTLSYTDGLDRSTEDVARAEPAHRPVADLDVDRAGKGEHRVAAGCVMPRVGSRRLEAADDDAAAGNRRRWGKLMYDLPIEVYGIYLLARLVPDEDAAIQPACAPARAERVRGVGGSDCARL